MMRLENSIDEIGRYKLDFDSPRTRDAASRLGIRQSDCMMKQKNEFFGLGVDSRIAKLSYDIHLKRAKDCIMEVKACRRKAIQRAKRLNSTKYLLPEGSIESANHSIKGGCADEPEIRIRPIERKAICDFISKVVKEQSLNRKNKNVDVKRNLHRQNISAQSVRNLGYTLSSKQNSIVQKEQKILSVKEKESIMNKTASLQQTFSDPLFLQVETRVEGAHRLAEHLKEEKDKQAQAELIKEKEDSLTTAGLEAHNKKIERAELAKETKKTQHKIKVAFSTKPREQIQEKAHKISSLQADQLKAYCIKKARKILKAKQTREENVRKIKQEIRQHNIVEYNLNKLRQKHLKEKFDIYQQDLRKSLEAKDIRLTQPETFPSSERCYLSGIHFLSDKLHRENLGRLQRIHEDKRRRIIQKHIALEEINKQRHYLASQFQMSRLNNEKTEKESTNHTLEVLDKLWRSNPNSKSKQEQLMNMAEKINMKFRLGMQLTTKLREPKKSIS